MIMLQCCLCTRHSVQCISGTITNDTSGVGRPQVSSCIHNSYHQLEDCSHTKTLVDKYRGIRMCSRDGGVQNEFLHSPIPGTVLATKSINQEVYHTC